MKLNEKISYYRKADKLSQEELAARVGVSRQAVSKWELGDATPEVDKLLALSRTFGVTTDELLGESEPGGPAPPPGEGRKAPPPAPGEAHLTRQGWIHNATVLSLAVCGAGLLLALGSWLYEQAAGPLYIGGIIQLMGISLFELAAPRMGEERGAARLKFYMIACWLVVPVLLMEVFWYGFWHGSMIWMSVEAFVLLSMLLGGVVTGVLAGVLYKGSKKRKGPDFSQKHG